VADTVNTTFSLAQPGANAGDGVVSIRAVPESPLVQELSNQTALIGQSVTLGPVYVDNTGQTTYQWMKDGVLLPGETGPTLTRDAFKFIDSGAYQVVLHKAGQGTTITRPAFLSATSGAVLGAWDENYFGQLGLGDTTDRCTPTVVPGSSNVVAAAAGPYFSLFVKSDGTLWAMGSNNYGQLGLGDFNPRQNPTQVPNVRDVVAVATGFYHALFLKSDGTVWAMGDNDYGELGQGYAGEPIATPIRVPGVRDVVAIAAGGNSRSAIAIGHSFFVKRDGSLWAVGRDEKEGRLSNNVGGVGLGGIGVITSPTRVPFVGDVVLISTGANYSFVMQRDGTLWGAGYNKVGQLGLGHFDTRYWFTQVPGVSNAIAATVNTFFTDDYKAVTHFVTSDGTASGMGYANLGVLGLGIDPCITGCQAPEPRNTPNRIPNFENVAAVSGADFATHFLKRDGTLWVTGKNGCQHRTSVPVQVDSPLTRTVASLARGAGEGGFLIVTQAPQ
jgi:alpha-tubulin suppressor-like RCC1 family protein